MTNKTQQTLQQRNYKFIEGIAPEVLAGTATYIKVTAGESFMPLVIERTYDDTIAVYHHYTLNGDLVPDPDMTFKFDVCEKTLSARSFQQGIPPIYQQVENGEKVNTSLERELNSFASMWFRNIKHQGYVRKVMNVPYRNDELELHYDLRGKVVDFAGEVSLIELYKKEHKLDVAKKIKKREEFER